MADVLEPGETTADLFQALEAETRWERPTMMGAPSARLAATQGDLRADGAVPMYRYPVDKLLPVTDMTPTVRRIRDRVEQLVGLPLGLNHALVQLYRDGRDHITPHADKTLDIARGSCVFNYSLGCARQMAFERKKPRGDGGQQDEDKEPETAVWLEDDSLMVMGPETNREFVHSVPKSRFVPKCAKGRERISITFRRIETWLSADGTRVLGQGAGPAGELPVTSDPEEQQQLIYSFALDNKVGTSFDWDKSYGPGSGFTFGFRT
jgi:alkylated DNA repair dioxygenase AlkB